MNSRDKGVRIERKFFADLKALLPLGHEVAQQLTRNLEQYRRDKESDKLLRLKKGLLAIEIKGRALGFGTEKAWLQQVFAAAVDSAAVPVLVVKYDRKPYLVYLPIIALAPFFGQAYDGEIANFLQFMVSNPSHENYHMASVSLECLAALILKMS